MNPPSQSLLQQVVQGFVKLNFSIDDAIRETEELLGQHNLNLCPPETRLAAFYKQCSRFRQVTETRLLRLPKITEKLPPPARLPFYQETQPFVNRLTVDYCNALIAMCNMYMKRGINSARKMHDQMQQTREIASRFLSRHREEMARCMHAGGPMAPVQPPTPAVAVAGQQPAGFNPAATLAPVGNNFANNGHDQSAPGQMYANYQANYPPQPPPPMAPPPPMSYPNGYHNHRPPFHGFRPRNPRFNRFYNRAPMVPRGGAHTIESLGQMLQSHQELFEKFGNMVDEMGADIRRMRQKVDWFDRRLKTVEAACGIETPEPEPTDNEETTGTDDKQMPDFEEKLEESEEVPEEEGDGAVVNHVDSDGDATGTGYMKQEGISFVGFVEEVKSLTSSSSSSNNNNNNNNNAEEVEQTATTLEEKEKYGLDETQPQQCDQVEPCTSGD